jgi:hypothetical protein
MKNGQWINFVHEWFSSLCMKSGCDEWANYVQCILYINSLRPSVRWRSALSDVTFCGRTGLSVRWCSATKSAYLCDDVPRQNRPWKSRSCLWGFRTSTDRETRFFFFFFFLALNCRRCCSENFRIWFSRHGFQDLGSQLWGLDFHTRDFQDRNLKTFGTWFSGCGISILGPGFNTGASQWPRLTDGQGFFFSRPFSAGCLRLIPRFFIKFFFPPFSGGPKVAGTH